MGRTPERVFSKLLCYAYFMNTVDLSSLLNKVFTVQEITVSEGSNFVNIRHDEKDIAKSKKYDMKTKSVKIKKQTV